MEEYLKLTISDVFVNCKDSELLQIILQDMQLFTKKLQNSGIDFLIYIGRLRELDIPHVYDGYQASHELYTFQQDMPKVALKL